MTTIKIHEQIAFLRKQKGLTQEDLAGALGVTNQAVSKWESAQCCPDITLLPDIANIFGVSIDELMGYRTTESFENIYLKLKSLFESTPAEDVFGKAYRLSILLHEAACTKGYKTYVPWNTDRNLGLEERMSKWDFSACSEPEGATVLTRGGMFISDAAQFESPTASELRDLYLSLERFCDLKTLKVLYALYELTVNDFDLYVPLSDIARKAKLSEPVVEEALEQIPVTVKPDEQGALLYRIEGCFMHVPSLLLMLRNR